MTEEESLNSQYTQALGFLTGLVPDMAIDMNNPIGMAEQIHERYLQMEDELTDQRVIGWLVFISFQFAVAQSVSEREYYAFPVQLPAQIINALVDRDWITTVDGANGPGLMITDKGAAIADINAPDWGIELDLTPEGDDDEA